MLNTLKDHSFTFSEEALEKGNIYQHSKMCVNANCKSMHFMFVVISE